MAGVYGTDFDDVLYGTTDHDDIVGYGGNDQLFGDAGNDDMDGGAGNDWLFGGAGADYLGDWQGADHLFGEDGDDWLSAFGAMYSGNEADWLDGGGGNDRLNVYLGGLAHELRGGSGADTFAFGTMFTASEPNTVLATVQVRDFNETDGDRIDVSRLVSLDSNLPIVWRGAAPGGFGATLGEAAPIGVPGFDALYLWTLQEGSQTILYADVDRNGLVDAADLRVAFDGAPPLGPTSFVAGTIALVGTEGDDMLLGTVTSETLYGLSGDDRIDTGGGADRVYGGAGRDWIRAGFDGDPMDGDDWVDASWGDDEVHGGEGNDTLYGGSGGDQVFGDAGNDILYADGQWLNSNDTDWAYDINTLDGGAGDDVLYGGEGQDVLRGGAGNDTLVSDGADVLWGEDGDDILHARGNSTDVVIATGGAGRDTFSFEHILYWQPSPQLLVTDFQTDDRLDVTGPIARAIPGVGTANPFDPAVGVLRLARDGGDTLLQWDRDGANGTADGWLTLARLQNVDPATLTPANFIGPNITQLSGFNRAPVLQQPLADLVIDEDTYLSFNLPAGTFADPDAGDTLGFGASRADGGALPSWLQFNPLTNTFSGWTFNSDVGSVDVRVTAYDPAGASASDVFTLTVRNVNDAPTLVNYLPLRVYLLEDTAFSYTVPANTFADVDAGDVLTYSADSPFGNPLPSWLSFDAATRTFSGTPGNVDVGLRDVRVIVTDTAGAQAATFLTWSIFDVNDAPTVAAALPALTLNEDAGFSYTVPAGTFVDIDAFDTLSYSAARADGGALPSWLTFDALTRTFSGTPGNGDIGVLDLVVRATDTSGASASSAFALDVRNVNDAPVAMSDSATTRFSTAVTINVLANDSDIDVGDAPVVASVTQAAHGSVALAANGSVTYSPLAMWNGSDSFSYSIDDGKGGSATAIVNVTVTGSIVGTDAADTLTGTNAADSIEARGGDDTVDGGGGNDFVAGGRGNDRLTGGNGNDALVGGAGNDTLAGSAGADVLAGGAGNDLLYGGGTNGKGDNSADTFVFNAALDAVNNRDTIYGFEANARDKIALDPAHFAALLGGASSSVDSGEFRAAAGGNAADANDFLLYDSSTGNLYYDADGNGASARVLIGGFVGLTGTLDASDFTTLLPALA
jgi:Ca2+-binding RTX toxin-like protein